MVVSADYRDRLNKVTVKFIDASILLIFALVYSFQLNNYLADYQPSDEAPNWKQAKWIQAGEYAGTGYFRKTFNLTNKPEKAYFIASGTDDIAVFVNEKPASAWKFTGKRPAKIMDVGPLLKAGKNVLAIAVKSNIHEVAPQLIGRLEIAYRDGTRAEVNTDQSWLVLRHEDFQQDRKLLWSAIGYRDDFWSTAVLSPQFKSLPLTVPENVYHLLLTGSWIWSGENDNTVIGREFKVSGNKIHAAWLGVSSNGRYSFVINKIPIVSLQGSDKSMELIDIGPYLRLGENTIIVEVENRELQPAILVNVYIKTDGGIMQLGTDKNWTAFNELYAPSVEKSIMHITEKSLMYNQVSINNLVMIHKEIELSSMVILREAAKVLKGAVFICLIASILFYIFNKFALNLSLRDGFSLFIRPFVLGSIILLVALLLRYELSLKDYISNQLYILWAVPLLIVFFHLMIYLESRSRADH